mgnify:CR=1 FL=1
MTALKVDLVIKAIGQKEVEGEVAGEAPPIEREAGSRTVADARGAIDLAVPQAIATVGGTTPAEMDGEARRTSKKHLEKQQEVGEVGSRPQEAETEEVPASSSCCFIGP